MNSAQGAMIALQSKLLLILSYRIAANGRISRKTELIVCNRGPVNRFAEIAPMYSRRCSAIIIKRVLYTLYNRML